MALIDEILHDVARLFREQAMAEALAKHSVSAASVAHLLDAQARKRGQLPLLDVVVPESKRFSAKACRPVLLPFLLNVPGFDGVRGVAVLLDDRLRINFADLPCHVGRDRPVAFGDHQQQQGREPRQIM